MQALFTIHAGEFLVGTRIEKNYRNYRVWIPSKDTGVDLLVTNKVSAKSVGLQVKFSRDFNTLPAPEWGSELKALGWWTLKEDKIKSSQADLWVFALLNVFNKSTHYVIVEPLTLLEKLRRVHGQAKAYQIYLIVTRGGKCWEARGLKKADKISIANRRFSATHRDFTNYLDAWGKLEALLS